MHRLSALIFLFFTFGSSCRLSQAGLHKKMQPATVVGAVYFDTGCLDSPKPIPGVSVSVECKNSISTLCFRQVAKTNKLGEFKFKAPFLFLASKDAKKIRECSVRLVSGDQPFYYAPATAASSSLHLKARIHGAAIFSLGILKFKPAGHRQACGKKSGIDNFKTNVRNELPPIPNPSKENAQLVDVQGNQPIIPLQMPPNPFYPPFVFPPNPFQPSPPSYFPPIPSFQSPPSMSPPATPSFNFPPTPGIISPPPATPRPGFPFPPFGF